MVNSNSSLGDMLRKNKVKHEEVQAKLALDRRLADEEKFAKEIDVIQSTIKKFKKQIEEQILNGYVMVVLSTRNLRYKYKWFDIQQSLNVKTILKLDGIPHVAHEFSQFKKWIDDNDLVLNIREDHDGMGMNAWTVFVIEPKT